MNINLNLFVTPVIALGLMLWGYFYFKKQAKDNSQYHQLMLWISLLAFGINWVWEVAQGPLYQGFEFDIEHISFCGLASVADMLMVILLWFGFALIYKNIFWVGKLTGLRVLWLILAGGVGAVLAEMRHTSAGNWSYSDAMPIIPWVEAGLSPVLQFSLLPTLIFIITMKVTKINTSKFTKEKTL